MATFKPQIIKLSFNSFHSFSVQMHVRPAGGRLVDMELMLQLLDAALSVEDHREGLSQHWVLECSPFPLLYVLSQLLNQTLRFVLFSAQKPVF